MLIPKLTLAKSLLFLFICFSTFTGFAQVGIGNTDPDPSAMLDITSDSQGILTPRMSTGQREAIADPANGLLVYDLDELAFYYYEETEDAWVSLNSSQEKRNNFKLIKSAADLAPELAAGGGSTYLLNTNTYYEINGTIALSNTIDLNNAYISGLDANEDRLIRTTGPIFTGSKGGSIKNVTLLGGMTAGSGTGTAFNIAGTADQNLLVQNTIIANMASVGTISGLGLYFTNIVQYSGNTTGITYSNIGRLLLSNQAWFGNNNGTFEKLIGSFALVQKVSGFSEVNDPAIGFDVNENPAVVEGVLLTTAFTGDGIYVNRYTTGSYPGFNFTNNWVVDCPGIPRESDDTATGNIYFNGALATGFSQDIPSGVNVPFNLNSNTTTLASGNSRMTSPVNNRLTYQGKKLRSFLVNANVAVRANTANTTNLFYSFFFRKNGTTGTTLVPTNTVIRTPGSAGAGSDIINFSISGTVELAPGEYIEIWGQRLTGDALFFPQLAFFAVNMSMK